MHVEELSFDDAVALYVDAVVERTGCEAAQVAQPSGASELIGDAWFLKNRDGALARVRGDGRVFM